MGYQRYVRPQRSIRSISVFEKVKLKISRGRKIQLVVSCQVMITSMLWFGGFLCDSLSHLIGRRTINIPDTFSGVHGFTCTGKAVK